MISGMNHITLAVKDVDKFSVFYRDVVGLKPRGTIFMMIQTAYARSKVENWYLTD